MKSDRTAFWRSMFAAVMIALLILVLGDGTEASAQVVTNTSDSGPGSLRDAITNASAGANITFATNLSGATILLASTLTINTNLTIDASALPDGIQISGNGSVQVFNVAASNAVVLNSLSIINGYEYNGSGAGIYNGGTLTVNACTLSGNLTVDGGGICNAGTLSVNECTLSGNSAAHGGGIYNAGILTVNQCTLSGNSASVGGDIDNAATLTLLNSIVAGSSNSGFGADLLNSDVITFEGSNIVQSLANTTTGTMTGPTPISAPPLLTSLGNYGGPTQTMPPLPGSPAIDAGSDAATNSFAIDQRGYPRLEGLHVDIGAVELQLQFSPIVTMNADSGAGSLRYAIAYATNATIITFATNLSGATITLASTLTINTNLTIDASALSDGIQINGNHSVRIFNVASNNTVVLNSLTISNGIGGIYNAGMLIVNQCTLLGNHTTGNGGGIFNVGTSAVNQCTLTENVVQNPAGGGPSGGGIYNAGTLTVNQCTLSGNSAVFGGGIYSRGTLTLINSIVAGNTAGSSADINGPFTCGGVNIVQNYSGIVTGFSPITNAPLLALLSNYGGSTKTMPPLPGSPAIDAGNDAATNSFATDQRGYPRLKGFHVDIGAVELPTIQFTVNPTNAPVGLAIQFNCLGVDSDGSAITQWNWNFGDVITGTAQNPAHVYATVGSFTPSLTVTNSLGLTLSGLGSSITILSPPAITGISLSGTNLVINGTNGISRLTNYVLTSTNVALPKSQWTLVATNIWSANGNFSLTVTNIVNPLAPMQFYLLEVK